MFKPHVLRFQPIEKPPLNVVVRTPWHSSSARKLHQLSCELACLLVRRNLAQLLYGICALAPGNLMTWFHQSRRISPMAIINGPQRPWGTHDTHDHLWSSCERKHRLRAQIHLVPLAIAYSAAGFRKARLRWCDDSASKGIHVASIQLCFCFRCIPTSHR